MRGVYRTYPPPLAGEVAAEHGVRRQTEGGCAAQSPHRLATLGTSPARGGGYVDRADFLGKVSSL
jgi:hypothetical protein